MRHERRVEIDEVSDSLGGRHTQNQFLAGLIFIVYCLKCKHMSGRAVSEKAIERESERGRE